MFENFIISRISLGRLLYAFPLVLVIHLMYGHFGPIGTTCNFYYVMILNYMFKDWMATSVTEVLTNTVTGVVDNSRKIIADAIAPKGLSLVKLAKEFNSHKVGIGACVKTISSDMQTSTILSEVIKINSMLGIEETIVDNLLQVSATSAFNTVHQNFNLEDSIPLLATATALMGKEIGDVDISKFINTQATNIKNIEVISKHVSKLLRQLGLVKHPNYSILVEINETIVALREEVCWATYTLGTTPNNFLHSADRDRLLALVSKITEVDSRIRLITDKELLSSGIIVDIRNIITKVFDIKNQVDIIKSHYNIRPLPVGICVQGDPQIGKSTLLPHLIEMVKQRLVSKQQFALANQWRTWHIQTRDEFDTGYFGQEITTSDDGFQNKENEDHKFWITAISPEPMGTVQAQIGQKGLPFESRICGLTCNTIPRTSVTINNIAALHERFPCTISAHLKPKRKPPKMHHGESYDTSFDWLDLKYGTMTDYISKADGKKLPSRSLDWIVDDIVEKIINNDQGYQQKVAVYNRMQQNVDDVDDIFRDFQNLLQDEYILEDNVIYHVVDSVKTRVFMISQQVRDKTKILFSRVAQRIMNEYRDSEEWILLPFMKEFQNHYTGLPGVVANIAVSELIKDAMGVHIKNELRKLLIRDRESDWADMTQWMFYMRHKRTKLDWRSEWHKEVDGSLRSFLMLASNYEIIPGKEQEFNEEWIKQPIVKVFDSYMDCNLVWGPALNGGSVLLPVSPSFYEAVMQNTLTKSHKFYEILTSYFASSLVVPFICPKYSIFAAIYASFVIVRGLMIYNEYGSYLLALARRPIFLAATTYISPYTTILLGVQDVYTRICVLGEKLSTYLVGKLITLLEHLGLDVSQLWSDILNITSLSAIHAGLFAVLCTILYVVYKYLSSKKSTKDKGPPIQHQSKGEKRVGRKNFIRKTKIRSLRQQWLCDEISCKQQSLLSIDEEGILDDALILPDHNKPADMQFLANKVLDYIDVNSNIELVANRDISNHHTVITLYENEEFRVPMKDGVFDDKVIKLIHYTWEDSDYNLHKGYIYEFQFCCKKLQFVEEYNKYISYVKKISEIGYYECNINCSYNKDLDQLHCTVSLVCLTANIQNTPQYFTKASLSKLGEIYQHITHKKVMSDKSIIQIVQECDKSNITTIESLTNKFQVYISAGPETHINTSLATCTLYGLGHLDYIILNAHATKTTNLIRWWRLQNYSSKNQQYQLAQIVFRDFERDIAIAKIVNKDYAELKLSRSLCYMATAADKFGSLDPYLLTEEQWRTACLNCHTICYLPRSKITSGGRVTYSGPKSFSLDNSYNDTTLDYFELKDFESSCHLAQAGDCGGLVVVSTGKFKNKIVGIHAASSISRWWGAILTKDDLRHVDTLHQNSDYVDNWDEMIVEGAPTDLPMGDDCEFLGKFISKTLPAADSSLKHWHKTDFAHVFEEQLAPGPLSARDERIEVELPKNLDGEKSLLLEPNSIMCSKVPELNQDILDQCAKLLVEEEVFILGESLEKTSDDIDEAIHIAMNGKPDWKFCTGIELNKASGVPWCFMNANKKSDLLDMSEDGIRSFNSNNGILLKNRLEKKLRAACDGIRLKSFSNSKLKDAVIKLDYVAQGRTRIFHCVPIDSILFDATLYANYKEAYSKAGLRLSHGIGTDPHSMRWQEIAEHLNRHPNVFDLDFKNYDKILHNQIMKKVFEGTNEVIQRLQPDTWGEARKISMEENIYTYVIDYDTVYKTNHGNKSGSYLTTIINCKANELYSFYSWCILTNKVSLVDFRENVKLITFGDDKVESVSNDYKDIYNYLKVKPIMTSIGHTITPGDKDGIEKAYTTLENISFLKRNFRKVDGKYIAPLLKRSIESPFVWTDLLSIDYQIWYNLVKEQCLEASLHGEEYYNQFIGKLKKCSDPDLLRTISVLLVDSWETTFESYKCRYYGQRI